MSEITGFPLSPQQAQWWRHRDSRPAPSYIQLITRQAQDIGAMAARLARQLANEEILRTRLQRISGMQYPLQVIEKTSSVSLIEKDWCGLSEEEVEVQLAALASAVDEHLNVYWITLPKEAGQQRYLLHLSAPGWMLDPMSLQLLAERITGLSEAPAEPLQYVDYSEWKQELLDADPAHPGIVFWQEQPPARPLHIGLENAGAENRSPRLPFTLPVSYLSGLTAVAALQGIPLAHLLQAAWQALLVRLSQPDTLPTVWYQDGRNDDTIDALGLYEQTLVCGHPLRLDQALTAQLKPFSNTLSIAIGWQDYFAGLEGDEKLPVFAWLAETDALKNSAFDLYACSGVSVPASLQLTCFAQGNGEIRCLLAADPSCYDADALNCLMEQWQQLLHAIIAEDDAPLKRLSLLGEKQRQRLISSRNENATVPLNFLQYWQQAVDRAPGQTAVSDRRTRISYAELDARSNWLARYLETQGVVRGDIVGIHLPRSLDAILAILATLKAGAAYLPLDPAYPAERLNYMVQDSGVRHVLGDSQKQPLPGPVYLSLKPVEELPAETAPSTVPITAEDTAYLIYTSGSSGEPKGVEISHGNLSHSLQARHRYYTKPVHAYLMLSSLSFDSSVAGIFWTLSQGGQLVLPPAGDELDMQALLALMTQHAVSHGLSLPSLYSALLDSASEAQLESLQKTLTTWIVAGEACSPSVVDKHDQHFPSATLVNEYGPTEATVWATASKLKPGHVVTIGRPIPGMQLYLLNEHDEPVAIGEAGEIYLAGPQLARRYRGKPEQTAAAFVTRPTLSSDQRLYRTGDLARWLPNGHLQFLGRRDHQVKIRGHRIELGEIETRLAAHADIEQAAVVMRDTSNGQRLVAYLTIAGSEELDTESLRNHLDDVLPDYMVPADFVVLQQFPLTPNGKLDIQALPQPEPQASQVYTAPRTEVEQTLATIIGKLLDRESVGIHDNFFHIGGDSILSLQVISRALAEGLAISARDIFEQKTIANIASKVTVAEKPDEDLARQEQHAHLIVLGDSELDALLDEVDKADTLA